ncbi:MAG: energy-coupling factor transporter transmembrane protein EcfT [Spirochaetaceae bacterium]|jgi:energy-coupling factor transporter transmembrane protein EcfT|nr:energy-coupling factor transporter transmembrane protein EcfT [Spirochaetaceae bacterium]
MAIEAPYSYCPKRTFIHRLNAGVKLLCLLVFSVTAFFMNPVCSAALTLTLGAAALSAGIKPAALLRGCRNIVMLGCFVIAGRSLEFPPFVFNISGFLSGLMFLWGMLLSFCAGALLFSVTTMAETREAVCAVERALLKPVAFFLKNVKGPRLQKLRNAALRPKLGLALSLMLGFIPRFFAEWDALKNAYRSRAGKPGVSETFRLVPIAAGRMIDKAAETASALEARGFLL